MPSYGQDTSAMRHLLDDFEMPDLFPHDWSEFSAIRNGAKATTHFLDLGSDTNKPQRRGQCWVQLRHFYWTTLLHARGFRLGCCRWFLLSTSRPPNSEEPLVALIFPLATWEVCSHEPWRAAASSLVVHRTPKVRNHGRELRRKNDHQRIPKVG